jgi:chaperonin GroES
MQLRPLGNHVIVEPVVKETTTASGIYIPDTADKEQPDRGTVIAVGPGKALENGSRQAIDLTPGLEIIFKKWGKEEIELKENGVSKKYLVLSADDIMAVIEK